MRHLLVGLSFTLLVQSTFGRDTGYALECAAIEDGRTQIVGFLEADVASKMQCEHWGPRTRNK